MRQLVSAMLVLLGIIHLLPLAGVLGAQRLALLYGTPLTDPNLLILMRHRAVLFGLLGLFFMAAAWRPALQLPAFAMAFASLASFLWLAWAVGGYNAQLGRVVLVDLVAMACWAIGIAALSYERLRG